MLGPYCPGKQCKNSAKIRWFADLKKRENVAAVIENILYRLEGLYAPRKVGKSENGCISYHKMGMEATDCSVILKVR